METLRKLAPAIIGIAALVFVVLYDRRNAVRAKKFQIESDVDFEELKRKYAKWETYTRFALPFFAILIASVLTCSLWALVRFIQSLKGPCRYIVIPSVWFWMSHALTLATATCVLPTIIVLKRLLGPERYAEFNLYGKLKEGTDGKRLLLALALMLIGANCVTLPLSFDWYFRITDDQILVSRFWGFGEMAYSFQDVAEVRFVKSQKNERGAIRWRKYHEIAFTDGHILSFDKGWHNLSRKEEAEIAEFVAQESQKHVKLVDPYPKP